MKAYEQFREDMQMMLAKDDWFNRKDRKGKGQRVKIPKLDDAVIRKIPVYQLYRICKRAEKLEKDRLKLIKRAQDAASALRRLGRVETAIGQAQNVINKAQSIYQSLDLLGRKSPQSTSNSESVSESVPLLSREPPWIGQLRDASTNLDKARRALQLNKGFLMGHKLLKKQKMEGLLADVVYGQYNSEEGKWLRHEMNNWWYPDKLGHERSKAAEQWLIREANDVLAKRLTVTAGQRIKMIRALLHVGLGRRRYQIKRISAQLDEPHSVFYIRKKIPT